MSVLFPREVLQPSVLSESRNSNAATHQKRIKTPKPNPQNENPKSFVSDPGMPLVSLRGLLALCARHGRRAHTGRPAEDDRLIRSTRGFFGSARRRRARLLASRAPGPRSAPR